METLTQEQLPVTWKVFAATEAEVWLNEEKGCWRLFFKTKSEEGQKSGYKSYRRGPIKQIVWQLREGTNL